MITPRIAVVGVALIVVAVALLMLLTSAPLAQQSSHP
jgi:hypothetical protein